MKTPVSSFRRFSDTYSFKRKVRELYSPYPYKGIAAFRVNHVNKEYPFSLKLINLKDNQFPYLYAHKWLVENNGILSDETLMTGSDGTICNVYARFKTEEDKVMFKLKFPELL